MIKINAYDEEGNIFIKNVAIEKLNDRKIIDFGWPVQYYLPEFLRHYPFTRDFCIDMGGLNHKGSPVIIRKEDMNDLFEKLGFKK